MPFRSDNNNYSGDTSGYITIPAEELAKRGIDIDNDDQEFYVFLRLSRVAGGIYTNENRSWVDSDYEYEFMIFDLDDFKGKGYANQKAIEKAVQKDIIGVLEKGIEPIRVTLFDDGTINPIRVTCSSNLCESIRGYCSSPLCKPISCACWSVFCKIDESVIFDLPVGKYLVAEIFRNPDGSIINNPDFVTINGIAGVFSVNLNGKVNVKVINDFSEFN